MEETRCCSIGLCQPEIQVHSLNFTKTTLYYNNTALTYTKFIWEDGFHLTRSSSIHLNSSTNLLLPQALSERHNLHHSRVRARWPSHNCHGCSVIFPRVTAQGLKDSSSFFKWRTATFPIKGPGPREEPTGKRGKKKEEGKQSDSKEFLCSTTIKAAQKSWGLGT